MAMMRVDERTARYVPVLAPADCAHQGRHECPPIGETELVKASLWYREWVHGINS
jgi:hypothetical protein